MKRVLLLAVFFIAILPFAHASIGLGVAPSKANYTAEGGNTITDYYLFYNVGTSPVTAHITSEGDIAAFTSITPNTLILQPESEPHTLPIKNGRVVRVQYTIPVSTDAHTYKGMILGLGGPGIDSLDSKGNVAAAFNSFLSIGMRVQIDATKTQHFWQFISLHNLAVGTLIATIMTALILLAHMFHTKTLKINIKNAKKKREILKY